MKALREHPLTPVGLQGAGKDNAHLMADVATAIGTDEKEKNRAQKRKVTEKSEKYPQNP